MTRRRGQERGHSTFPPRCPLWRQELTASRKSRMPPFSFLEGVGAEVIGRLLVCGVLLTVLWGCAVSPREDEHVAAVAESLRRAPAAEPRVVTFGNVVAYPDPRRIEADVEFCLKEGILEYFAVAEGGKAYESVLVVMCEPSRLHAALVALGYEPGDVPAEAKGDFVEEFAPGGERKPGSRLDLFVEWTENGQPVRVRAEKLLLSIADDGPAGQTYWTFTGSYFAEDETGRERYAADFYRSVIAVWYDPSAVINLPVAAGNPYRQRAGFAVNTEALPTDTKARLVILPHSGAQ